MVHWVGLITWSVLGYLMKLTSLKWRYAAKYFEVEPVIVIMDGSIIEQNLKHIKKTKDWLLKELKR